MLVSLGFFLCLVRDQWSNLTTHCFLTPQCLATILSIGSLVTEHVDTVQRAILSCCCMAYTLLCAGLFTKNIQKVLVATKDGEETTVIELADFVKSWKAIKA